MSESEQPKLTVNSEGSANSNGRFIYLDSLVLAVAQAYEVALAAGWETKALDPLTVWLREYHNKV